MMSQFVPAVSLMTLAYRRLLLIVHFLFFIRLLLLLNQKNGTSGDQQTSDIMSDSDFSIEGAEMGLRAAEDTESRFVAYVEGLVNVIGHADRAGPLRDYCTGLVMPCERKSVGPMAAETAADRVCAQQQALPPFVGEAAWAGGR